MTTVSLGAAEPLPEDDSHLLRDDWAKSVVARAFALLDAFSAQEPFFTLGELSERANLPRSTTHRLATMLVKLGALQRRGNLGYIVGARMFDVGLLAPVRSRLLTAAEPYLHQLHETTRGTVHLASWSGERPIYLDKVSQPGELRVPSRLGAPVALHATALGKCLVAFTPDRTFADDRASLRRFTRHTVTNAHSLTRDIEVIRGTRIGRDNEESVLGITCIGSPIIDRHGECVAAISISVPTGRLRARAMEQLVLKTAQGIGRAHDQGWAA